MNTKYFGTDGIRGVANRDITPELAFKVGQAAGRFIHSRNFNNRVIIARDTRRSSSMLDAAISSGFCSVGIDVDCIKVAPTGCVSYLTRTHGYGMGVMISASHNPAPDNGIKLIGRDGKKLSENAELDIETLIDSRPSETYEGASIGIIENVPTAIKDYTNYLMSVVPEGLQGFKVAIDAANGAAYEIAPELFKRLGAEVYVMGDHPNGMNINHKVGATHPDALLHFSKEHGADLGISFDGDADRAIFADEEGNLLNGDRAIALWATYWHSQGGLKPPIVVGTIMSNGGFEAYLNSQGIQVERTNVGDKYVSQKINELSTKIGGEQSGHIIFPEHGPTGDGLITALEVLRVMKLGKIKASKIYHAYEPRPQLLVNIEVGPKANWENYGSIMNAIDEVRERLGEHGRIAIRLSGTQLLVRVMVEADTYELRDTEAKRIVSSFLSILGGKVYSRVDLTHDLGE